MTGSTVRKEEKPKGKKRKKIIDEDDPVSHLLCLNSNNNFNLVIISIQIAGSKMFKIWLEHEYLKYNTLIHLFFQNIARTRSFLKVESLLYPRCLKFEFV